MGANGGLLEVRLNTIAMEEQASTIHPDLHAGTYLDIMVGDIGHGLAPDVMERIFEPYFTTKVEEEGTGLGLAVIHGIVKGHSGAITVESAVGKGSKFHVFLPIHEPSAPTAEVKELAALPKSKERILFIDDELDIVEIAKEMFKPLGYEVVTRTSSIEALELFRSKPDYFDLVISDLTMPNMTGGQLARRMMHIRSDIPIILCTGFSREMTKEQALSLGIKDFLMKPLDICEMAVAIRHVLDKK